MAKYKVTAYARHVLKYESAAFSTYKEVLHDALLAKQHGDYTVITVLKDSEGEDHPSNAGKFFLERIIK